MAQRYIDLSNVPDYTNGIWRGYIFGWIPGEARLYFFASLLIFFVIFELQLAATAWNVPMSFVLRYLWFCLLARLGR
jgi:hypothetical protein